jgi:hypothetical protein
VVRLVPRPVPPRATAATAPPGAASLAAPAALLRALAELGRALF